MRRSTSDPVTRSGEDVTGKRRLLLLSCSQRKIGSPGPIIALRRYDGPTFRVLRKYLRARRDPHLNVFILSAKYGLIPADKRIGDYDKRLDARRAVCFRPTVTLGLSREIARIGPASTLLCVSKLYLTCIGDVRGMEIAERGQGRKLAHLKAWLYNT